MRIIVSEDNTALLLALDKLEAFAKSPKPVLREFARYARRQHIKAVQGRYNPVTGKPWKPLRPSTIAQKQVTKPPKDTILNTLYTSVGSSSMTIGYGSPIAPIQHFGAKIPARTIVPKNKKALFWVGASHPVAKVSQPAFEIPARPRIGFSRMDLEHLEGLVFQEIDAIWNQD